MNRSNWTLRFPRTSREAFGHQAIFRDSERMDRAVLIVCLCALAFAAGLMVGGATTC